jgi:apolipoprotein D and lipocalin family protein
MDTLQKDFDLERYQGLWYDVARFPKFFDKTTPWQTAEYTLKNDEKGKYVEVYNTAYNKDGSVKKDIFGKARIVNPEEPAALYVSFSNIVSFFFGDPDTANYLVHETDYDSYAVVGSYDRTSLYLLARQRPVTIEFYEKLLKYVNELGYDIRNLQEDYGAIEQEKEKEFKSANSESDDECVIF